MYAGRIPAINNSKMQMRPEMTTQEMNSVIPRHVQWKADNYNHLYVNTSFLAMIAPLNEAWYNNEAASDNPSPMNSHEQPTIFYAIMGTLIYLDAKDPLTVNLAWGYVGMYPFTQPAR